MAGQPGVGVGAADDLVAALGARVGDARRRPAPAGGRDEVVAGPVGGEELGVFGRGQGGVGAGKPRARRWSSPRPVLEQLLDVPDHLEPRDERAPGCVGLHRGRVEEQLVAPHEPRLDAQPHDPLEEPAEDLEAVALADARQRRVVGQRLVQVVAEVPPQGEPIRDHPHEPAFGAQVLEEHHQLQLEEDDWVHRWPAATGVKRGDDLPRKREVDLRLQPAVEVVRGDQLLQRDVAGQRREAADLRAHHGAAASCEKGREAMLAAARSPRSHEPYFNGLGEDRAVGKRFSAPFWAPRRFPLRALEPHPGIRGHFAARSSRNSFRPEATLALPRPKNLPRSEPETLPMSGSCRTISPKSSVAPWWRFIST